VARLARAKHVVTFDFQTFVSYDRAAGENHFNEKPTFHASGRCDLGPRRKLSWFAAAVYRIDRSMPSFFIL
jgi:hypothetical protein